MSMSLPPAKLAMTDPPDVPVPHRFNDPSHGVHAFPHATVTCPRSGERVYQLQYDRSTTLSFKFNHLPAGLSEGVLVCVRLSLEIQVDESTWKEATPDDFPGRKGVPGMDKAVIQSQDMVAGISLAPDGSATWEKIQLNALSSQTYPPHRQLRFKVVGVDEYAHRSEFAAHTVPFVSVAKTISSVAAGKARANPVGPTEHERELEATREASKEGAQALHAGQFKGNVAAARRQFANESEKMIRQYWVGLEKDGEEEEGEEEEGEEEDEGEEAEEEDEKREDRVIGESEEAEEEDEKREGEGEESEYETSEERGARVVGELEGLRGDSISLLENDKYRHGSTLFRCRKERVTSLFTEAVEVAKGRAGKGVDLGAVERTRLDFRNCPYSPVTAALDDALKEYMPLAYAGVGGEQAFEQHHAAAAARSLKDRILRETEFAYWENEVQSLDQRQRRLCVPRSEGELRMLTEVQAELRDAKQKLAAVAHQPRAVANEFAQTATAIDTAIRLAQRAPSEVFGQLGELGTVDRCSSDVVTAALSSLSPPPPPATAAHWHSFVRKAKRVRDDMHVHLGRSMRCDARLLVGALGDDDIDAMTRAATLLRRLAADSKLEADAGKADGKPSATLLLADPPMLLEDEPSESTASAIVQPIPARMTERGLPAIEAIEGSRASALLVPTALLSMPPRCILSFIAEKTPLPPNPLGSELLAERALPDVVWLLDTFMDDSDRPGTMLTACPFRGHLELHPSTLDDLKENAKRAAARLRGEAEPEPESQAASSQDAVAISPGVEFVEEDSGVDEEAEAGSFYVRYAFKLTLRDGSVRGWKDEVGSIGDRDRPRKMTEAECHKLYADSSNKDRAVANAREELERREREAARQAAVEDTEAQKKKWQVLASALSRSSRSSVSEDPEASTALCNAARVLSKVQMDFDGDQTRISGGGRRSAAYNDNGSRRSDDRRRTGKSKATDLATMAPVQLDCKRDLELEADPERSVCHFKALGVLKSIAAKAGLAVAQVAYSESKSGASESKSKRTTRRENFIPILDIKELSSVANAVIEAIQLFSDPSRKAEQKAWLAVGQKRKRGA